MIISMLKDDHPSSPVAKGIMPLNLGNAGFHSPSLPVTRRYSVSFILCWV